MEKNLVNISVNTTHTPVPVDHNKESKMNDNDNEMNDAVEGILYNSLFGLTFPLVVTYTARLAMGPGDTAFLLIIIAVLTAVTAGSMSADLRTRKARFVVEAHHVACACLTSTALFRCLTEGLGTLTDYQSVPAAVVTTIALSLQLAAAKAFAASIKR